MEERLEEILALALQFHVSDIHFTLLKKEDGSEQLVIEMRVHGKMKKLKKDERDIRLFRYLMYRADLDLSSVFLPQTGSFEAVVNGRRISLRFAIMAGYHQSSGVLRILNDHSGLRICDLSDDEETVQYLSHVTDHTSGLVVFSGPTGSGKTTFLNALSEYIPKTERLITIEDSAELQINGISNLIRLETRNANVEGKNRITIRDLIKTSLRMRPDRIIVGEVRDDAAIDMLSAMNTGHSGSISTGHANSARDMLFRLETMVLMGMEIPIEAVRRQISSALDIIIHLGRMRDKTRKVIEISEVMGMTNGEINLNTLYKFEETAPYGSKVKGELVKYNELADTSKLASAGLLGIYRESDLCSIKS